MFPCIQRIRWRLGWGLWLWYVVYSPHIGGPSYTRKPGSFTYVNSNPRLTTQIKLEPKRFIEKTTVVAVILGLAILCLLSVCLPQQRMSKLLVLLLLFFAEGYISEETSSPKRGLLKRVQSQVHPLFCGGLWFLSIVLDYKSCSPLLLEASPPHTPTHSFIYSLLPFFEKENINFC